jgi:hypothetical protein
MKGKISQLENIIHEVYVIAMQINNAFDSQRNRAHYFIKHF